MRKLAEFSIRVYTYAAVRQHAERSKKLASFGKYQLLVGTRVCFCVNRPKALRPKEASFFLLSARSEEAGRSELYKCTFMRAEDVTWFIYIL